MTLNGLEFKKGKIKCSSEKEKEEKKSSEGVD